ncbi:MULTISPECIES: hypothetical protein [Streptomyces]|uniref:Uncharacterized protein n=1 Tax=Streptomyces bacillaris TaxID=68179 RepID=A0ABW6DRU7_9ACTN|nr:hypothetical protein [Streptomyces nanshensis]
MFTTRFELSTTDVRTCEACWREPVDCARQADNPTGRDLLCWSCAASVYPVRVELFPPLGIYALSTRHKWELAPRTSSNAPRNDE